MNLKEKILLGVKRGLDEALCEHLTKNYGNYRIYVYFPKENEEDHNFVKANKGIIYNFFNDGYIAKGFKKYDGCFDKNSLGKNASCIKIAKDTENEIIAISAYSSYLEGYKCVGIAATTNHLKREVGKDAAITIIKQDIANWKGYWWCECSDTVEHYYEKFGAIHIPAQYAPIFGLKDIEIVDEYHYERYIAQQEEPITKTIYGFNSEETYNKIINVENRILRSVQMLEDDIKNIKEDYIIESVDKHSPAAQILQKHRLIINVFFDAKCQGVNEFTKELLDKLTFSIDYVETQYKTGKYPKEWKDNIELAIENGKDILASSTELKLNRL